MYIDYYYAPISGYAYLGEPRLVEIAAKWDVDIRYKPVDIVRVFAEAGTVPPPKQSKARLDYRVLDLQRNADYLQLPINPGLDFGLCPWSWRHAVFMRQWNRGWMPIGCRLRY